MHVMRIAHFAVASGGHLRDGYLVPPSADDILLSADNTQGLGSQLGSLIYAVRAKYNAAPPPLFVSAHLDRSKLTPDGTPKRYFRAYRKLAMVSGRAFLPCDMAWTHAAEHFEPGQDAEHLAKSWFYEDQSQPQLLVEEAFCGGILIASRTIATRRSVEG
jgi:hypothetical protein